jgi:hypothetical protein
MSDRWNNYGATPDEVPAAYDAGAADLASDRDHADDAEQARLWELEKQKAREWADKWLPRTQLTRRQAQ